MNRQWLGTHQFRTLALWPLHHEHLCAAEHYVGASQVSIRKQIKPGNKARRMLFSDWEELQD